jgi:hypothetical protein
MKYMFRVIAYIALVGSTFLLVSTSPLSATTNVLELDIQGFRLGQTVEEIKTRYPSIKIDEIKPDKKSIMGYRAKISEVHMYFTSDALGKKLFRIQLLRIFPTKQDPDPIFKKFVERYGRPDYSGRQMLHIQACWGKCIGDQPRLEFRIKISNIGLQPYPMTLTLSNPKIEKENRRLYLEKPHLSN